MNNALLEPHNKGYAFPDALVSTEWLEAHRSDPNIRLIESNEDPLVYPSGHIPGAAEIDWIRDLNDPITRDYLSAEAFQKLVNELGITQETTIVFYGDKSNWWATYAMWVFELFGYQNSKILDGGRLKWVQEGRALTREIPNFSPTSNPIVKRNDAEIRAFRDQVMNHLTLNGKLIDVRSPKEFSGEVLHMEGYPNEGALRGGHIPTAKNVPWAKATNPENGTFLAAEQLKDVYEKGAGLSKEDDVVVYCRIGERSSHTWFALKYLLGYPSVKNYDGSWTEWGNLVGAPIEKGS